jgi:hypothetical protein
MPDADSEVVLFAAWWASTSSMGNWVRRATLAALLPARAFAADAPSRDEKRREPPPSHGSVSVALLAGWSHGDELGSGGFRTLFGYGARAGYRFEDTRLYLGVTVMAYSDEIREDPAYGGMLYGTEHLIYTDVEIGAEYPMGSLILRPYLGLGALTAIYDAPPNGGSGIGAAVIPGIHARYPSGPVYLGIDVRLELGSNPSGAALGCIGLQLETGGG